MNRSDFGKRPRTSRAVIEEDEPSARHRLYPAGAILLILVLAVGIAWMVVTP